jgi:hypothetical protein
MAGRKVSQVCGKGPRMAADGATLQLQERGGRWCTPVVVVASSSRRRRPWCQMCCVLRIFIYLRWKRRGTVQHGRKIAAGRGEDRYRDVAIWSRIRKEGLCGVAGV